MGISGGKKTTQTNKPIYSGQIEGQANNLASIGAANQGVANANQGVLQGLIPTLAGQVQNGNPAVNAAQGYITDTLGADPGNNPFLDDMIARTNENTRTKLLTGLGTRGLTGGSVAADMVTRALSENELGMRYSDWNNAQARRAQAAGMAPGVAAGSLAPIASLLGVTQTSTDLPVGNALKTAAGVGGLLGPYQTTTQKQSGGFFQDLLGSVMTGFAMSDIRTKTDIARIGTTDAGLPLYRYRYLGDERLHFGPMAQDVAVMQPDNLGPEVGGFMTVNYAGVR